LPVSVGDDAGHGLCGEGLGEEVALAVLAFESLDLGQLAGCLDTFGHDQEPEGLAELHDGVGEDAVNGPGPEGGDEGPVDLEDIGRNRRR